MTNRRLNRYHNQLVYYKHIIGKKLSSYEVRLEVCKPYFEHASEDY